MSTSRQQLYAAGEPFGDSATRREVGRVIYGGGGDSSSSSSTTANTTDRRMVIDGGVGVSSDSSTVNVNALDAGAIQAALNFAAGNDAAAGEGFSKLLEAANKITFSAGDNYANLLDATESANKQTGTAFNSLITLADKVFTGGAGILDKTASATLAQVAALNTAQNDAAGSIDQKTMIVLGITAAVGVYAVMGKNK